jgi:hypothetical protein
LFFTKPLGLQRRYNLFIYHIPNGQGPWLSRCWFWNKDIIFLFTIFPMDRDHAYQAVGCCNKDIIFLFTIFSMDRDHCYQTVGCCNKDIIFLFTIFSMDRDHIYQTVGCCNKDIIFLINFNQ